MNYLLLVGEPGTGKILLLLRLIKECNNVVWVTTTRSARAVRKIIKREDIWIVDTYTWARTKSHPRDVIIEDPLNINRVSLGIERVLDSISSRCLLIFDSISGLLIYHPLQKIIQFLKGLLVKIEGLHPSVFTLIKNAHDRQTELTIYMMFPSIIEFIRRDYDDKTKRFLRVIKATEFIDPDFSEFNIVRDGIILPKQIENYILKVLGVSYLQKQSQDISHATALES